MTVITGFYAGNLDARLTIQSAADAQTTSGAIVTTYTTFATVWGEVREPREREVNIAAQTVGQIDRVFLIRWSTGVTQKSRILYDDGLGQRTYEILGPPEEIQRRQGLRLQARVLRAT